MAILTFNEWTALHEAARRSFTRTLAKFDSTPANKPVAILTAWRGELPDASGKPHPEAVRRKLNDEANRKLAANVRRRGLSIVPVVGAGQEEGEDGVLTANREDSYIVQPVGEMGEKEFLAHIKDLLHNPTGEPGRGPYPHTQWGGVVKLPSQPRAFIVHQPGRPDRPRGLPHRRPPRDDRPAPEGRTLLHAVEVRPEGLGFDDGRPGQAGRPR